MKKKKSIFLKGFGGSLNEIMHLEQSHSKCSINRSSFGLQPCLFQGDP